MSICVEKKITLIIVFHLCDTLYCPHPIFYDDWGTGFIAWHYFYWVLWKEELGSIDALYSESFVLPQLKFYYDWNCGFLIEYVVFVFRNSKTNSCSSVISWKGVFSVSFGMHFRSLRVGIEYIQQMCKQRRPHLLLMFLSFWEVWFLHHHWNHLTGSFVMSPSF